MKTICYRTDALHLRVAQCVCFALMSAKTGQGSLEERQMELSEQGKGAVDTAKIINQFADDISKLLGENVKKEQIRQALADAIDKCFDPRRQDMERKARLERHVHVLQTCYRTIMDGDDWERLQEISSALVAGGMAIQRMLKEDYPEQKGEEDAG